MSQVTRVHVRRNPEYKAHGTKSYVYMLNKYGFAPTMPGLYSRDRTQNKLVKQLADGSSGAVKADDQQNDAFYTCDVQIGTPPQTVSLDFDSGSSDLWVWSTKLPSNILQKGKKNGIKIFDSSKSSTFQTSANSSWKIQYGDGSGASGVVGTDTVKIGDISIDHQAVELANKLSAQFQSEGSSGLLGLAFGNINTVTPHPVKTPVDNMIAQKDIPASAELFTCYLGSVKDQTDPDQGESFYTFGSIDQSVVEGSGQEISYTPVDNSQGFWMFDSASATVNGKTIDLSGNKAIADTGTTLMLVSDELCKAIYGAIEGSKYDQQQQGYLIPSTNVAGRPAVTVAVGGKQFTIEKEQLGWQDVGNGMTYGAIQSRGDLTFDIFGDTFLICVYAIFDVGNQRFGCVQRSDPTPAGQ